MRKIALTSTALVGIATPAVFAGNAKPATAAAKPAATAKPAPVIAAATKLVPMPDFSANRGTKSVYPFDTLTEKGMSFGVLNKDAKSLSTVISNANRKGMVAKRDAEGNIVYKTKKVKDANGVESIVTTTDAEKVSAKHFKAVDVDPKTDPDKASVRVFRDI